MPAIFKRKFRVRHYECDVYGHLNNVNYLRYMQETALDATAAVGWDVPRYESIKRQWLIRESDIHYLQPLIWNDEVEITSYVVDFRRVQSRRRYEFHRVKDGVLVAEANTNWVFLDTNTMLPASIPDEMIVDFAPDGLPEAPNTEKFPKQPSKPEGAFTLIKRVEWRDIDTVGHVNNAAYMTYCEDASTQVGRDLGWSMQAMLDDGIALVLRRFRIQYLQSAVLDDKVAVTTWLSNLKRATGLRHYELVRLADAALLAKGYAEIVCFDLKTQRPMRIPENLLADFADNVSPENIS